MNLAEIVLAVAATASGDSGPDGLPDMAWKAEEMRLEELPLDDHAPLRGYRDLNDRALPVDLDAGLLFSIGFLGDSPPLLGGGGYLSIFWDVSPKAALMAKVRHSVFVGKEEKEETVIIPLFGTPVQAITKERRDKLVVTDFLIGIAFPFEAPKHPDWTGEVQLAAGARRYDFESVKESFLVSGGTIRERESSDGWTGVISFELDVRYRATRHLEFEMGVLMEGGPVKNGDDNTRAEGSLGLTLGARVRF